VGYAVWFVVLVFVDVEVAVLLAFCVAALDADGMTTPLPLGAYGELTLDADCPATPADGAPWEVPASCPRP
jgi:hypothetical protein